MTVSMFVRTIATWAAAVVLGASLLGAVNYRRHAAAFDAEARTLHRVLSQRADQHDAHLTALAAVLASSDSSLQGARAVADAVRRFYPRVFAVDVVELDTARKLRFTTREQALSAADIDAIAERARHLPVGRTALLSSPTEGRYTLVKRLGAIGQDGPGVATLEIDAARLAETEGSLDRGTALSLLDPDRGLLLAKGTTGDGSALLPPFTFEQPLGSRSQPLVLRLSSQPVLTEVLSPGAVVGIALVAAGGVALVLYILAARREAREAERQALLLRHDARLAHVMRIDALGEMGSGIAHELTQPLTAILSGAQAGLRMVRASGGLPPEIATVLEANVRQARRAGDILGRLRAHAGGRSPEPRPVDVNALVSDAADLVMRDLEACGVVLALDLDEASRPVALADPVSVEQVVHNLVRNAADAMRSVPGGGRTITVSTRTMGSEAAIAVTDEGPGIAPADLPRLFEPFFTTKPDGMGLGLSLCERLAEAFGGRIVPANRDEGGAVFTLWMPLAAGSVQRAAE